VVISYAWLCLNEAKKLRSTVSTITSSSTIRTRFVAAFVAPYSLISSQSPRSQPRNDSRLQGRALVAVICRADATAVINVTRAIVAALETVEDIRDHLGADS